MIDCIDRALQKQPPKQGSVLDIVFPGAKMSKNPTTKQNIIDAFWSIYIQKDISKISIKEVSLKAGYNRSTLYEYFSSTYEILETIENGLISSIDDLPPFTLANRDFGMATDRFLGQFENNLEYYEVLLSERGDLQFQVTLKHRIKDILLKDVFGSQKSLSWKIDFALEYSISGLLGIMHLYFTNKGKTSKKELHDFVRKMLDKGCMSLLQES
jgi:AcrR family transcriptional regulator